MFEFVDLGEVVRVDEQQSGGRADQRGGQDKQAQQHASHKLATHHLGGRSVLEKRAHGDEIRISAGQSLVVDRRRWPEDLIAASRSSLANPTSWHDPRSSEPVEPHRVRIGARLQPRRMGRRDRSGFSRCVVANSIRAWGRAGESEDRSAEQQRVCEIVDPLNLDASARVSQRPAIRIGP